jgi:hypothetical protein
MCITDPINICELYKTTRISDDHASHVGEIYIPIHHILICLKNITLFKSLKNVGYRVCSYRLKIIFNIQTYIWWINTPFYLY